MKIDPEIDSSSDEWKSVPSGVFVLVLMMSALIVVGGMFAYLGPDVVVSIISKNPGLLLMP